MKLINRYIFIIAALFLIIFELIHISKGQWDGDFWEHSAVVNELSKHLIHPNNPIIKTDSPHAFFSPYSILVAVFSKITNLNSIQSLACFAVFNLFFFVFSFYLFCKDIFKENHQIIASISLFFILFFWGENPWGWSGFYHIMILHNVLPYPSTFAMCITLLILSMVARSQPQRNYLKMITIILLSAVVFITHPPTAIFLNIGIIALNFSLHNYSIKQFFLKSAIIIIPSALLCLLWPYYNMIDLILGNNVDFNNHSQYLYLNLFDRYWPILLILPGLFFIKKDKILQFLFIALALMILVYFAGYLFKIYGVSRLISNMMMFAHLIMAYFLVLLFKNRRLYRKGYLIILIVSITTCTYINRTQLIGTFDIFKNNSIGYYQKYNFLRNSVASDDVILSAEKSNWYIPTFNGKVISSRHPIYWVRDIDERRSIVNSFFTKENSDSLRQTIIQKYKPDYLLIDSTEVQFNGSTMQWLKLIGETVYEKDELELIKIR